MNRESDVPANPQQKISKLHYEPWKGSNLLQELKYTEDN